MQTELHRSMIEPEEDVENAEEADLRDIGEDHGDNDALDPVGIGKDVENRQIRTALHSDDWGGDVPDEDAHDPEVRLQVHTWQNIMTWIQDIIDTDLFCHMLYL
jgi:hypothetical protein